MKQSLTTLIWRKLLLISILISLPSHSTQTTYYVTPTCTPDTPCPGEPCHTLSQYTGLYFKNLSSNTTLVFLPGDHTLNHTIAVAVGNTNTWTASTFVQNVNYPHPSITLLGSPLETTSRITCTRPAGFAFSGISELYISALAFISCGHDDSAAINAWSVSNFSILNCTFQNNINWLLQDNRTNGVEGGVLHISNSTLTLTGSTFQNNYGHRGGALFSINSVLTLIENTFQNNTGEFGGAIYVRTNSTLMLTKSVFQNNTAESGGALFVSTNSILSLTENTFHSNLAKTSGGATAVYQNSTLSLTKNILQNNSAYYGGVLHVYRNSNITLTENIFQINSAEFGGALFIKQDSILTLTNNTFQSNLAEYGAAVYVHRANTSIIAKNIFQSNLASEEGGALFIDHGSTFTIILTKNIFQNNSANIDGGAITVIQNTTLTLAKNTFQNNSVDINGGALYVDSNSNITLTENTYQNNSAKYGGALFIDVDSTLTLTKNTFQNNLAKTGSALHLYQEISGGAVRIEETNTVTLTKNIFQNNLAESGGGALSIQENSILILTENTFQNNVAANYGGAVFASNSNTLILTKNSFRSNIATESILVHVNITLTFAYAKGIMYRTGGVIYVWDNNTLALTNNTFQDNSADHSGGAISLSRKNTIGLTRNTFQSNSVCSIDGGALHATENNTIILMQNTFLNNSALYGGAVSVYSNNTLTLTGNFFQNNFAFNGGALFTEQSIVNMTNDTFIKNTAQLLGGTMFCITNDNLRIHGNLRLWSNIAEYGGGMAAIDCQLTLVGNISFENNIAIYGGGLYADSSYVRISGHANFTNNSAVKDGGGAYASRSVFITEHSTTFLGNSALSNGGGMALTGGSKLYFQSNAHINFSSNLAMIKGGALMVEESSSLISCAELSCNMVTGTDCFFQIQTENEYNITTPISEITELYSITIYFKSNCALEAGATLYGSSIDRCSLAFVNQKLQENLYPYECSISGQVFDYITSGDSLDISSDPLYICTCEEGNTVCSSSTISMSVYPGGTVKVPVIAYGQRNGTTPAVIHSIAPKDKITFDSLENSQNTATTCTVLKYTIQTRTVETFQEMKLYAEGPCPPRGEPLINPLPTNVLTIYLKILQCPPGFKLSETLYACVCEERLKKLTNDCRIDDKTVKRDSELWVGYTNDSNSKGLILHSHCPFDYCSPSTMYIAVDDSDQQCSNYRSGLLCGKCMQNVSLALGSSRCLRCSNHHYWLLAIFAIAGLVLVFLIFMLNFTVAAGTINGLVFYANIIAVNSATFFQPQTTNILTIFIAWLNLDLGIETCFYDGMDTYAKTWLQFVFPFYVWALVIGIITVSHYSIRISTILSNNTVAVLATLILLSYAKLLRTIITALSYTRLEYPNNSQVAVWLYDGNIRYLSSKHIPLFIAALAFLIFLFIPYTLVLLFGQWIRKSKLKAFCLVNNYQILFFRETYVYHAPYIDRHRYWTGLMLTVRCFLFLAFAFNVFDDPSINLLCIGSATALLLILTALLGNRIYKSTLLNILELSFNSNLSILATATLYVRSAGGNQNAVTFTSISVAFVTFVGIVIYHLVRQFKDAPRWWRRIYPSRSDNYSPVLQTTTDSQPQGTALPSNIDPSSSQFATVAYININDIIRAQLEESAYRDTNL